MMRIAFRQRLVVALRLAFALAAVLTAKDARAVDPFEIQIYDGSASRPGVVGLELHMNRVFDGVKTSDGPELPMHHQTHLTLEPSVGVLPFLELGGYLQTALRADGTFDYGGTKLRAKLVTPEGWHAHLRLGANLELSVLPARYDVSRWGSELRPIVAWEDDQWLFAANPIVGVPLGAPGASAGPTFEPAGMVKMKLANVLAAGLEYYADLGPIAAPASRDAQRHYVYEVVDVLALPGFELNAGIGQGLTPASNAFVAKVIVGFTWEPAAPKP